MNNTEPTIVKEVLAKWSSGFFGDELKDSKALRRKSKDAIIQSVTSEVENGHNTSTFYCMLFDNWAEIFIRPWNYKDYLNRLRFDITSFCFEPSNSNYIGHSPQVHGLGNQSAYQPQNVLDLDGSTSLMTNCVALLVVLRLTMILVCSQLLR